MRYARIRLYVVIKRINIVVIYPTWTRRVGLARPESVKWVC